MKQISHIFQDPRIVNKIKQKLPYIFQIAEIESSRAGKIGMEVGTIRERIIVALLLHAYGNAVVDTNIPTTLAEVDVKLNGIPISIKTFTGERLKSLKLIWTVDPIQALNFQTHYIPSCGMLVVQINWGGIGYIYYFTEKSQKEVLHKIGRDRYIKLPPKGTNPRGVEISEEALSLLTLKQDTLKIQILWRRSIIKVDTFERWIKMWEKIIV